MRHLGKVPKAYLKRIALTLLVFVLSQTGQAQQQETPRITGTYSNMYYNQEGGDVLGDEIRIVATPKGYQGVLQFAEGVPGDLFIVDVKAAEKTISFAIPGSSIYSGAFTGTVENGVLKGEFRFKSGASEKVSLPRGKSYWD